METFSGPAVVVEPWWVTGLCDGEASFTYSRSSAQIALYFAVKLTASERPILEQLQSYFGVGKLYDVKARSPQANSGFTKSAVLYRVTRHDELPRVVEHFDAYPLKTLKRESYRIWREMVELKRKFRRFRDGDRDELEEYAVALTMRQASKQSWR